MGKIYAIKYERVSDSVRDDFIISARHEIAYVDAEDSDEAESIFREYSPKNLGDIISIEEISLLHKK